MRVYNIVLTSQPNVGDKMASPLDYFKFPVPAEKIDTSSGMSFLNDQFIIYGGGGLIHLPAADYNGGVMEYLEDICTLSRWMVSWGVGHNIHHIREIEYPKSFVTKFALHGVRDMYQALPWVPCASCMSHLFDWEYPITRKIMAAGHHLDSYESLDGLPKMEHTQVTPAEAVKELASAETVITNSYHGAYWAALLGRKVIVFDPMSSKFFAMPSSIVIASPTTWMTKIPHENKILLDLCRRVNTEYYNKVLGFLEEVKNER